MKTTLKNMSDGAGENPASPGENTHLAQLLRAADEADRGDVVDVSGLSREQYLEHLLHYALSAGE